MRPITALMGLGVLAAAYFADINKQALPKETPIVQESTLENRVNSEPTIKLEAEPKSQTLNIFKGYETRNTYDKIIIEEVNFWNNALKHLEGYQPLDPNLIKAQVMQETGNHQEYNTDPMQITKDFGLKYLQGNDKRLEKLGFNQEQFKNKFTKELGIKGGIAFLVKNAIVWNANAEPVKLRSWEQALEKYNGGGTQKYGRNYTDEIKEKLSNSSP